MAYKQYSAYGLASETVGKPQQVVMLYDGIVKFARKARSAIEENKIEERFNNLQRACRIVLGLQSSLDFENGGQLALILNNFYSQVDLRLMKLNQSRSVEECDGIIDDLKKMRDAWANIGGANNDAAAASVPGNNSDAGEPESVAVSI